MQTIEFLPDYSSWDDWNGNMALYFAEQLFPVMSEIYWREVAQAIAVNSIFSNYNAPGPDGFNTWQDWARALTLAINGDRA
jgi:hypothetical protein